MQTGLKIHWLIIYVKRTINLIQILLYYLLSRFFKTTHVSSLPFAISIEPTNRCNLSCVECIRTFNSTITSKDISPEQFENIIKSIYHKTFYVNLYFQGEPLMNKNIHRIINVANKYKLYTVISTNAHFLTKDMAEQLIQAKLSKIIISIDGMTQESYSKYRQGGQIQKVIEGITNLLEAKQKYKSTMPKIIAQFLVNKFNEHEIPSFLHWAKKLKIKPYLKTMQIYYDYNFLPSKERYKRYKTTNNGYTVKKKKQSGCWRLWSQCVITADGNVLPCCFDKTEKYIFGNVFTTPLKDIWKNKQFKDFRKNVLYNKKNIEICSNCTE